jgi:hypothetical protein
VVVELLKHAIHGRYIESSLSVIVWKKVNSEDREIKMSVACQCIRSFHFDSVDLFMRTTRYMLCRQLTN